MHIFESITRRFVPETKAAAVQYRSRIGKFQGWISIAVNSLLFLIKFIIGILAGSVSVIADAVHTLSDVVSSAVLIWGFNEAEKPADVDHPYGHGRAEYISTLIIAILLVVVGIEFIKAAFDRILNPQFGTAEIWMIVVIALTIVVKEIIARYSEFLSAKIASGTLHADAWHHHSDAMSSGLVLVALVAGRFGYNAVDGWAGLGVALFLIYTGWKIAKVAIDDLIGKPPTIDEVEEIRRLAMSVEGVLGTHDITVHSYGRDKFISLHVEINAAQSPDKAHDISEDVETKLESVLLVEPTVHVDPIKPDSPMIVEVRDRLQKNWVERGKIIDMHDIRIVETEKHNIILFGIKLKQDMMPGEIVECCHELEADIRSYFPGFEVNVKVSHLSEF